MSETPLDLELLATFVAVAEHTSFSKAAKALGVGKGTVSRAIAQLEGRLGVELLHRTTHHVGLSTAGLALFERTRDPLRTLRQAVVDLPERDESPSGLLRMTAPLDIGAILLTPVMAAFSRRYPGVRFDLRLTESKVDIIRDGYDIGFRVSASPLKDSSLIARRLGRNPGGVFASPAYLARRGRPRQLADERHTWILHPVVLRMLNIRSDSVQFVIDSFQTLRDLARDGLGVTVLPTFVANAYVREGLLEALAMPGLPPMTPELFMVYPSRGQAPKKVLAFRDFLVQALRAKTLDLRP